jgi:hypothetical protein
MKTWVVAFLNLGQGELLQYPVEAESKLLAYKAVLDRKFGRDYWREYVSDVPTEDDIEEMVFNCDCYISALEIPT